MENNFLKIQKNCQKIYFNLKYFNSIFSDFFNIFLIFLKLINCQNMFILILIIR